MPDIQLELSQPLVRSPDDPHTIRLGIVLNGTVSAGAWTAGVLDALFEALDLWEAEKAAGGKVPTHKVRLEVVGGASGGSVCAALLARAATRSFPHVRDRSGAEGNPFWSLWVKTLRIEEMLEHAALDAGASPDSLLSGMAIERAMDAILAWEGTPRPTRRAWLADPFHVLMTQTNLRGVPYGIEFRPGADGSPRRSQFVAHADHVHFALPLSGNGGAGVRGDEFLVPPDFIGAQAAWKRLAVHARASGAFPFGFPPVRLDRPTHHYDWRAVLLPGGPGREERVALLKPAWPGDLPPVTYTYDAVDGGALNNSPFALVRSGLAGFGKGLDRDPETARATIVVVDPFVAQSPVAAPDQPLDLLGVAGGFIGSMVGHGRYSTAELLLALDQEVASRFLLTAGRDRAGGAKAWGEEALTTSGLGAFLGFLDPEFRVHDFLLGRRNALSWMTRHFMLPATNPVFGAFATGPDAADYRVDGRLPIIPVVPPLRALPAQPAWPAHGIARDQLKLRVRQRLRAVVKALAGDFPCDGLVAGFVGDWGAGRFMEKVQEALTDLDRRA